MEQYIKIAADSVGKLRVQDVYRVLDCCQEGERQGLAAWLVIQRPDLAVEVASSLSDIAEGI